MRRSLAPTVAPLVGLALACGVDEPTGPDAGVPAMEARPTAPAAVVITRITAVDQVGDVGAWTSLASGSDGRQHIVYQDLGFEDLRYATCATSCGEASNWTKVRIDVIGEVGHESALALGANGRLHVTHYDRANGDLKYTSCAPTADCSTIAGWKTIRLDTAEDVGRGSAIALGPGGLRHVSYFRRRVGTSGNNVFALRYAVCSTGCGQVGGWSKLTIEEVSSAGTSSSAAVATSIAIGPDGRRHISYINAATGDLKYATCLSGCTSPGNWQKLTIDQLGLVGFYNSLAVGPDGVLHVSYYDGSHADLKYARCAADCTTSANWRKVTVASSASVGHHSSLAIEPNGRVHISSLSHQGAIGALHYATCTADCTLPQSWSSALLDGASSHLGNFSSITARNGVVRISYFDAINRDLKYLSRTPLINPF